MNSAIGSMLAARWIAYVLSLRQLGMRPFGRPRPRSSVFLGAGGAGVAAAIPNSTRQYLRRGGTLR